MARTLDPAAHAVKRDLFVDVAQRLIQSKGYSALSISDVLAEVGASKGAFYHYFDSKEALLDAVVERVGEQVMALVGPIVDEPDRPAIDKLQRVFGAAARVKGDRKALMVALRRAWLSDENVVFRERVRRYGSARLAPLLERILRQGIAEGVFRARAPEEAARVLAALMAALNEELAELFVRREAGEVESERVTRLIATYTESFERILGAPPGSITIIDEPTRRFWFA